MGETDRQKFLREARADEEARKKFRKSYEELQRRRKLHTAPTAAEIKRQQDAEKSRKRS